MAADAEIVSKLAPLLIQHSMRLTTMWGFQVVVAIGVIGWAFSHPNEMKLVRNRALVTIAIVAFAVFTWMTVSSITERKLAVWEALEMIVLTNDDTLHGGKTGPLPCGKPEEANLTGVSKYVCALKPHSLSTKFWGLVGGNAVVLFLVWFVPIAMRRTPPKADNGPNKAIQPTDEEASD